jgi:hypothetical protein
MEYPICKNLKNSHLSGRWPTQWADCRFWGPSLGLDRGGSKGPFDSSYRISWDFFHVIHPLRISPDRKGDPTRRRPTAWSVRNP